MSDELMELPEGWAQATFGDICKVQGGYAFKSQDYQEHGVLLIRISNLVDEQVQLTSNSVFLPKHYWEKFLEFQLKEGDVLIAMSGATTGKMATYKLDSPALLNQRVGRFKIKDLTATTPSYVAKLVESITEQVLQQAYGGAQPNISPKEIEEFPVPLPPLNEQKRIVAAIESLRERSQKARSALSAIPELCDKFRQSVLAAAFRGNLTADWREQNPDVEWEEVKLGEIIKSKPRNGYSPKPVDFPTKVKSLTLSATTSGKFKPEHYKYINEEIESGSYLWLSPGDILIQRSNTLDYVGTCAIYDGNFGEFIYPDLMMKIQVIEEKAKPEFVHYILSSRAIRKYFKENATGTAGNMPKINQPIVMNTPIVLPPINEQVEIVHRIQQSFNAINRIFQENQEAKERLNLFDRSILAKAFRGELVEQDPNDEPASVLLEHIRADREQQMQGKIKKPGKKKRTGD